MGRVIKKRLLLIDDDFSLLKILSISLKLDGYSVDTAANGLDGLHKGNNFHYDVIILDMGLPKLSGLELCKKLRLGGITVPILVLSGDTSKKTIIHVLQAGADDYLAKPFDNNELQARLSALIRRDKGSFPAHMLVSGTLTLDIRNHTLQETERKIYLTPTEVAVMRLLMQNAPDVISRIELFNNIWGINSEHSSNRLDVYILRIRHKLNKLNSSTTIHTIHGEGYCLKN